MALVVENGKVGSLVWVLRKNGTWWPGKIEFYAFDSKTGIKLLGKENGSVEWFNLQNSKRVKAFRSVEFDGFIKSAESSMNCHYKKSAKYTHRQDAILHALSLEKQEQEKGHKRAGDVKQGALGRAKRSRCAYLTVESNNSVKGSIPDHQSLRGSCTCEKEGSCKSGLGEEKVSSESTVSESHESMDSDDDGDSQLTGTYTSGRHKENLSNSSMLSHDSMFIGSAGEQNWNLQEKFDSQNSSGTPDTLTEGELSPVSRKQVSNTQDLLMPHADCQAQSRYKFAKKSCTRLALEVNMLSNSTSAAENSGSESLCIDPVLTKPVLVDVDVRVEANYRKEDVPLVSLMSRLNKVAIIGHPLEVDVLENSLDDFLCRKGSSHHSINNSGSKSNQLVWKTSKRTSVCYTLIHYSSATSSPEAKKTDVLLRAKESLPKPPAKGNLSLKNGHRSLISSETPGEERFKKRAGNILSEVTCVPVNLIFSKLFSAIST